MFQIPSNFTSQLFSTIGNQLADSGTLLIIVLAAGIPLTFYVIRRLIGLVPKEKEKKWYEKDPPEVKEFKEKYPKYYEAHKREFEE